jgi:hypothetical protein
MSHGFNPQHQNQKETNEKSTNQTSKHPNRKTLAKKQTTPPKTLNMSWNLN